MGQATSHFDVPLDGSPIHLSVGVEMEGKWTKTI